MLTYTSKEIQDVTSNIFDSSIGFGEVYPQIVEYNENWGLTHNMGMARCSTAQWQPQTVKGISVFTTKRIMEHGCEI